MSESRKRRPDHLAWHETLEIHELVAMQSTALMKMKNFTPEIKDKELKKIYQQGMKTLGNHLETLMKFYSMAPREDDNPECFREIGNSFYAAEALSFSKAAVKAYANAITETATATLRQTLVSQMQSCIKMHADIFEYMYQNGLYPAYDLHKLLEHDMKNAQQALEMRMEN
ncbi:spore coat protein [Virgibacillus halophilus]|uniref:Spore coat protein n=1 Tax=Tigheibacillus halophilus TaxID=361280 RepID=A0ABU5CC64_9BACI|nr:spore coat protein [Virgibacillus halophilus]